MNPACKPLPCAKPPGQSHSPVVQPATLRRAQTLVTELFAALACFALGLVLVLGVPGVAAALRGATEAILGRPNLPAETAQVALSLALTPFATLVAALLYRQIGRALDTTHSPPQSPIVLPLASPLRSLGLAAGHLAAAVFGSYLLGLMMDLLGRPVAEQPVVLELVRAGGPALMSLTFSALVLAPLAEEAFFRGGLFRRLTPAGLAPAYLFSALLFALFHGNLQGFIVYLWLGLVFARAFAVTGRLSVAMAVHFGNNALTLLTLLM